MARRPAGRGRTVILKIKTILAPTDFSPHSDAAVRYACGLAETFGATLHLLHVLNDVVPVGPDPMLTPILPPDYYREIEDASSQSLTDLLDPAWGKPLGVETAVRWGNSIDVIFEYAAVQKVDLIVIATHGRTGFSHALLGSFAERIVRESPCPVLTLRDSGPSAA